MRCGWTSRRVNNCSRHLPKVGMTDLWLARLAIAAVATALGLAAVLIIARELYPSWFTDNRRRALIHGLLLGGWIYTAYHLISLFDVGGLAADARFYWSVNLAHPYVGHYGDNVVTTLFPYSPAAALLAAPFGLLAWPAFVAIWLGILLLTTAWLAGRSLPFWLAFPPLAWQLGIGNIEILMAAAVVLGFRWPQAWAAIILTKVTPGIGLLWFVVRREWMPLARALLATAVIATVTIVFLPTQWSEWVSFLRTGDLGGGGWLPLQLRLPLVAALIVWGARTDRRWTLLVGMLLAVPQAWFATFGALVALARPEFSLSIGGPADRPRLGTAATSEPRVRGGSATPSPPRGEAYVLRARVPLR